MKKIFIALVGLSLFFKLAFSQNYYPDKAYFKSYLYDGVSILKSPVKSSDRDIAIATSFIATSAIVMANDKAIADFFQRNKSQTSKRLATGLEKIGNGSYCFPAVGVLYLSGLAFKSPKIQYTGLQMFKSMLIAGGITGVIKVVAERERPFQSSKPYIFHGLFKPKEFSSFPSGHTCDAFAMASVLSSSVSNKLWNIPIYTIAAGVGLSRIHDNKHWASDVLVGAAIGYCVGKIVMHSGNYPFHNKRKQGVTILPRF